MADLPTMNAGLFEMLRFLRHEFERSLEYVDQRLAGFDALDEEGSEQALEIVGALLEEIEFTRGYFLDAFRSLGSWTLEAVRLPTPAGVQTVAVLVFEPEPKAIPVLELPTNGRLFLDGVYCYLQTDEAEPRLWMEVGLDGPLSASTSRLTVLN